MGAKSTDERGREGDRSRPDGRASRTRGAGTDAGGNYPEVLVRASCHPIGG